MTLQDLVHVCSARTLISSGSRVATSPLFERLPRASGGVSGGQPLPFTLVDLLARPGRASASITAQLSGCLSTLLVPKPVRTQGGHWTSACPVTTSRPAVKMQDAAAGSACPCSLGKGIPAHQRGMGRLAAAGGTPRPLPRPRPLPVLPPVADVRWDEAAFDTEGAGEVILHDDKASLPKLLMANQH